MYETFLLIDGQENENRWIGHRSYLQDYNQVYVYKVVLSFFHKLWL